MRIISGSLRGSKLYTLEGLNTRPTLDRVKEALFSKINFIIKDRVILDLFSGSGALALEAISRGAKISYLCDSSKEAIEVIKKNIEKTRTEDKTVLLNCDYKKALEKFIKDKAKFDIVFLDPPYLTDYAEDSVQIILENNLLSEEGLIILETDNINKVTNNLKKNNYAKIIDVKKYGRVYLVFLSCEA